MAIGWHDFSRVRVRLSLSFHVALSNADLLLTRYIRQYAETFGKDTPTILLLDLKGAAALISPRKLVSSIHTVFYVYRLIDISSSLLP